MAGEELQIIYLRDDFYRDGFYKALLAVLVLLAAIVLLTSVSVYLVVTKPAPVEFSADNEWRVLPPVPLDLPYLTQPDLLQWISNVLPTVFGFDFVNYAQQIKNDTQYFTVDGWKKMSGLLANYADYNVVQTSKLFINAVLTGAPYILNQGLLQGRYGWWVQVPIDINYNGVLKNNTQSLVLQVLIVRIPTLNNLSGVAIDNIIVSK